MALIGRIASAYQNMVGKTLARYGLRYDDILAENAEVNRAISWLPQEEQLARERRLTRAADCSLKRTYLPESLQQVQEPMNFYLYPHVQEARKLQNEREDLTRW